MKIHRYRGWVIVEVEYNRFLLFNKADVHRDTAYDLSEAWSMVDSYKAIGEEGA